MAEPWLAWYKAQKSGSHRRARWINFNLNCLLVAQIGLSTLGLCGLFMLLFVTLVRHIEPVPLPGISAAFLLGVSAAFLHAASALGMFLLLRLDKVEPNRSEFTLQEWVLLVGLSSKISAVIAAILDAASALGMIRLLHLVKLDRHRLDITVRSSLFIVFNLLWLGVMWLSGAIFFHVPIDIDINNPQFWYYLSYLCLETSLSLAFLLAYAYRHYRSEERKFQDPQCYLPIPSHFSAAAVVNKILKFSHSHGLPEMQLKAGDERSPNQSKTGDTVSLWFWRSNEERGPRLYSLKDKSGLEHRLVFPRPFLEKVLPKDLGLAESAIAHEVSHAYQQDAVLWPRSDLRNLVLMRFFAPQILFQVLFMLVLSIRETPTIMRPAAVIYICACVSVRHARRKSEYVADVFAAIVVGYEQTTEAIKQFAECSSPLHPSPKERLKHLADCFGDDGGMAINTFWSRRRIIIQILPMIILMLPYVIGGMRLLADGNAARVIAMTSRELELGLMNTLAGVAELLGATIMVILWVLVLWATSKWKSRDQMPPSLRAYLQGRRRNGQC